MIYAKLFDSAGYGQLLVKLDRSPEGDAPEVRFYCSPPGLGVCSMAMGFTDDDNGWDAAEAAFEKVDCAMAEIAVRTFSKRLHPNPRPSSRTMTAREPLKLTLARGERIIAVVPERCQGPGWANAVIWVYIATSAGGLRTECIQPGQRTPEMQALFEPGAAMCAALIASIPKHARPPTDWSKVVPGKYQPKVKLLDGGEWID
jgi:hypothetical protein